MYTVADYYAAIDSFAPFALQESWDNSGLLIGSPEQPAECALLALDATAAVIEEAGARGRALVVSHHPIIFEKLSAVSADSMVYAAIRAGVGVLCAHTNLDIARGGVNDALAARLELSDIDILEQTRESYPFKIVTFVPFGQAEAVCEAMAAAGAGRQGSYAGAAWCADGEGRFMPLAGAQPAVGTVGRLERVAERRIEMLAAPGALEGVLSALRAAHPYEEPAIDVLQTRTGPHREGLGRVGGLPMPLSPSALAAYAADKLGVEGVRFTSGGGEICRVAVCGGAGGGFVGAAAAKGAQALIVGEARHSHLLEAKARGLTLIDAGHYATEAVVLPVLLQRLREALPGADIAIAHGDANPMLAI